VSDATPQGDPIATWPDVDVVMPIRNEAEHLGAAVAAVRSQEYPGRVRIFLGVGPSDDGTERVAAELAATGDDLVVVENPSGLTPSALNVALRAGAAPIVVRVDGHSELSDGYIQRAVETMQRTDAVNVGGLQVPVATTPFEQAVAAATTSWLGTGGASYRVGGEEGPVDTVFLGVFDRSAIEAVGLFDERLIRNQDYELNIRLREAGGAVWFDPALSVGYRPRGSWTALAKQYYEYGYWKAAVMRLHPDSARLRQVVPPVAVGGIVLGAALSPRFRWFALAPAAYGCVIAAAAARSGRRLFAVVTPLIHVSWSTGLLVGLVRAPARDRSDHRWPTQAGETPHADPTDGSVLDA
jgi:glycosyltransferase involved in cell wall biosynthesis